MNVTTMIYETRARTIEQALESWQVSHNQTMQVYDLETMIAETVSLHKGLLRFRNKLFLDLFSVEDMRVIKVGNAFLSLCDLCMRSVQAVQKAANETIAAGWKVERADELPEVQKVLEAAAADFRKKWPFPDQEAIARGRRDVANGRVCDVETLLNELSTQASR